MRAVSLAKLFTSPFAGVVGGARRALSAAIILCTATLAFPARADLEICNRTSFVIETALGIEDQGVAATRGWFRVDPGACRAVMRGDPAYDKLYVHARTLPLYGAVRPLHGSETELCVGEGDFLIPGARKCSGERERLAAFGAMSPQASETGRAIQVIEPAEYGPEQARVAAIQRLLTLAGHDAEPIDGVSGPRTDAAIGRFLRERNLQGGGADAADLLERLLAAVREGAGPGLLWCNETAHTVMAALGIEEGRGIVARGWWRIEPGACLRPELPQRAGARLYSFAEAVDAAGAVVQRQGKPLAWGGAKPLCVRNSRFEIGEHGDCAGRGLDTQGFATVELSERAGATLRFREP